MTDFSKDEQALFMNMSDKDRSLLSVFISRLDNATKQENNKQIKEKYLEAINYYLKQDLSVSEILKLIDVKYLGDHYSALHKKRYELDNTAVGYLLGLSANDMTMFRVSVTLKEDVIPQLLQMALIFSEKRFPIFSCIIKDSMLWPYMETTANVPLLKKDGDFPCISLTEEERKNRSYTVFYKAKTISMEVSHAITDATGALTYLKSIVREYARLTEAKVQFPETYIDCNSKINEKENEDEYKKVTSSEKRKNLLSPPSQQIADSPDEHKTKRINSVTADLNKLKDLAKEKEVTISAYILAKMFLSIKEVMNGKRGIINIQVPVNMRKFYNSATIRNFSMFSFISEKLELIKDDKTLYESISRQLKTSSDKNTLDVTILKTTKLMKLASYIPFNLIKHLLKPIYKKLDYNASIAILSNLGTVDNGEKTSNFIDYYDFIIIPIYDNKMYCTIATYADKARINIATSTKTKELETIMIKNLL